MSTTKEVQFNSKTDKSQHESKSRRPSSVSSRRSRTSRGSTSTSLLIETKTTAKKAEANATFVQQEAEVERELQIAKSQAAADMKLKVIRAQKEAAMAAADYASIKQELAENGFDSDDDSCHSKFCLPQMPLLHRYLSSEFNKKPTTSTPLNPNTPDFSMPQTKVQFMDAEESTPRGQVPKPSEQCHSAFEMPPPFSQFSDLSNYLLKRELLINSRMMTIQRLSSHGKIALSASKQN